MINILSYVGMNMHSELCLWTLLGLIRTIFDATLFKVNANLKQVWQMSMPDDLSMPVQRALRTMISGVMLAQCFTVYVYLASYIVLLYPIFLEERPALVLPWLLLAATRKLLCELTSLALGLGTCVLLGPARPPCIKFLIKKLMTIMPAFYMWMLVFGYYHALKVATAFNTSTAVLPPNDHDYGLELAIRRRKTKSLMGEDQLRSKLVASLYAERPSIDREKQSFPKISMDISSCAAESSNMSIEEIKTDTEVTRPMSVISNKMSDSGSYEDWYGSDVVIPRDADRILEQFVLMMLRVGAYLRKERITLDFDTHEKKTSHTTLPRHDNQNCTTMPGDETDTPPFVGSSKGNTASYVREYPQIFMKRTSDIPWSSENKIAALKTVHNHVEDDDSGNITRTRKRNVSISRNERVSGDIEKITNKRDSIPENENGRIEPIALENEQKQIYNNLTIARSSERKQTATKIVRREKSNSATDLDQYLEPTDSLTSIMENVSQTSNDTNNSFQVSDKEDVTNKHELKDKQDYFEKLKQKSDKKNL